MNGRRYRAEQFGFAFLLSAWGLFEAARRIASRCPCCDCP